MNAAIVDGASFVAVQQWVHELDHFNALPERRHCGVYLGKGQGGIAVMETSDIIESDPGFVALATANGTLVRSVLTGLVVGTILTAINQGDVLMAGETPSLIKIGLNYLVPYCVATYSAVTAKQYALRHPRY